MKFISLSVFLLSMNFGLKAQDFLSPIYIKSILSNEKDTIYVGYDEYSSIDYDYDEEGENLVTVEFGNKLDIRLTHLTNEPSSPIDCRGVNSIDDNLDLFNFQAKKDIIPFDCKLGNQEYPDFFSHILIPNRYFPIELSWSSEEFLNSCYPNSFITYLHPFGWWDSDCGLYECVDFPGGTVLLSYHNKLKIDCPAGLQIIDQFGDTLSLLTIGYNGSVSSSVVESTPESKVDLFTINHGNFLRIKNQYWGNDSKVKIFDLHGRLIASSSEQIVDISYLNPECYIILLYNQDSKEPIVQKFVKHSN